MKVFQVGIRRIESASVLRVSGMENARWLLERLSDSFVFKTSEPMRDVQDSSDYTFCVAHNSQMSGPCFERLLAGFREVKLVLEQAKPAIVHD